MTLTPAERAKERRKLSAADRALEFHTAAEDIRSLREAAVQARDLAIAAMCDANTRALTVGTRLLEYQERFQGDFDEWLDGYCSEWFSRRSAYRWMAKVRDLRAVLGNDDPTLEELKKALIASEVLPSASASAGTGSIEPPLFRLKLDVNGPPPEEWDATDRREFLTRAQPVVDLYERVRAAEEAA